MTNLGDLIKSPMSPVDPSACFFCGKSVTTRKTREHVFSDGFLDYLGIKQENVDSSLPHPTTYSKLKIPAHGPCNNELGSRFDNEILQLLPWMDSNVPDLMRIHRQPHGAQLTALREGLTQWFAKLYYGLIYWEAGLKTHGDKNYQSWLISLLTTSEFVYLRRCFMEELAFKVPSSLFYFHVPGHPDQGLRFDFANGLPLGIFYLRFGDHLFVSVLGDANLVHQWFSDRQVEIAQSHIEQNLERDPVAYLNAVAHIWSVRENLPIEPQIEIYQSGVRDRSIEGRPVAPPINVESINQRAYEIQQDLVSKWKMQGRNAPPIRPRKK